MFLILGVGDPILGIRGASEGPGPSRKARFGREVSISAIENFWEAVGIQIWPFPFEEKTFLITSWGYWTLAQSCTVCPRVMDTLCRAFFTRERPRSLRTCVSLMFCYVSRIGRGRAGARPGCCGAAGAGSCWAPLVIVV